MTYDSTVCGRHIQPCDSATAAADQSSPGVCSVGCVCLSSGRTVTHWSLAVDLSLGPHSGGCATCSGVVTVDVPSDGSAYTVRRNNEYYTLGHFASFIPPGSVKLATTQQGGSDWSGIAVQTTDSGRVVQLLNNNDDEGQVVVLDEQSGGCFVATVAGKSLSTFVWSSNGSPATTAPVGSGGPSGTSSGSSSGSNSASSAGTSSSVSSSSSSGGAGGSSSSSASSSLNATIENNHNGAVVAAPLTAVAAMVVAGLLGLLCL